MTEVMTMTELADPPALERAEAPGVQRRDLAVVKTVADNFVTLMRTFNRARARMMQATEHDVEWASHMILRCVKNEGSMRSGAIAECLQNDPSTVSRQVAALVKDGFLERRADPDDGRASLLVLTPQAELLLDEHDQIRVEYFGHLVQDWSDDDLVTLASMLERFTQAYEAADNHWIKDRLATRAGRAGSNA